MNLTDQRGESLDVSVSGAGTLKATGYVQTLTALISGAGEADLKGLVAEKTTVNISGAGDAEVYAAESIDATVSGAGDVVCFGNPNQIIQNTSGAGDFEIRTADAPIEFSLRDEFR